MDLFQSLGIACSCDNSKRLNCVNHARRLANGDWTGVHSDEEEDIEKQEGEQQQDGTTKEEEMEVERRKPRSYANQVQFRFGKILV